MKCVPTKKDFGLIITSLVFLNYTGAALYNWLFAPEIMLITSYSVILYIMMVIQVIIAFLIHYSIPIASFNVTERTIEEVGIFYKVKFVPKFLQFYGHLFGKTLIGLILLIQAFFVMLFGLFYVQFLNIVQIPMENCVGKCVYFDKL
jgi:hypothetical protein